MSAPLSESLFGGPSTCVQKKKIVAPGNFHNQNLFSDKKVQIPEPVVVKINSSVRGGQRQEREINITTPIQPRAPPKATREITENLFDSHAVIEKEKKVDLSEFKFQPVKGAAKQSSKVITENLFISVDKE
jgi:hypothetical protein